MSSSGGAIAIFLGLLFYLVLASGVISWTIYQKDQVQISEFNPAYSDIRLLNTSQIFTNSATYNDENMAYSSDNWEFRDGIGIYRKTGGTLSTHPIVWKNIIPIQGNYTNTYVINNSVHGEFTIWLRYTGSYISSSDTIYVRFDDTGIHIPAHILDLETGDFKFYPITGLLTRDNITVKTVFNNDLGTASIYVDGIKMFDTSGLWKLSILSVEDLYYGAIESQTEGFALNTLHTTMSVTDISYGILDSLIKFVQTFFTVLVWNVDESYLPWIWNILLIKIELLALLVFFFMMVV